MSSARTAAALTIVAGSLAGWWGPAPGTHAQSGAQAGEWRAYAADKAASKYSPLDQIDRGNAADLRIAWRQSTVPDAVRQGNAVRAPARSQNTPLMVGGRLYISTGLGSVAALDAATGEVVWFDDPPQGAGGGPAGGAVRGVAYWRDDSGARAEAGPDERIIAVVGPHLVALDARTGQRRPDFGDGGAVDLRQGYDGRTVDSYRWRSAPIVVNDVIVVGSYHTDYLAAVQPVTKAGPRGDVRGYDVRTGEQLWIFHTIPARASSATRRGAPIRTRTAPPGSTPAIPTCGRSRAATRRWATSTCR